MMTCVRRNSFKSLIMWCGFLLALAFVIIYEIQCIKQNLNIRTQVDIIVSEIKYFPVARSSEKNREYVYYEDSWGDKRTYGGKRKHEGTDIMAGENVRGLYPVVSMTDGIIENAGWLELGGYRIGVRSENKVYYYYAHLYSFADGIVQGKSVKAGQLLGYMGDSGYGKTEGTVGKFAVHLHIGIYVIDEDNNEQSINPYPYLKKIENSVIIASY